MPKHHKRILSYVRWHIKMLRASPTFQEIVNATSIDMLTVYCAVRVMIWRGTIGHNGAKRRYITIR